MKGWESNVALPLFSSFFMHYQHTLEQIHFKSVMSKTEASLRLIFIIGNFLQLLAPYNRTSNYERLSTGNCMLLAIGHTIIRGLTYSNRAIAGDFLPSEHRIVGDPIPLQAFCNIHNPIACLSCDYTPNGQDRCFFVNLQLATKSNSRPYT